MNKTNTTLRAIHKELITTFFKANNLETITVSEYEDPENYGNQKMIRLWASDEDDAALTFLACKHSGVQNMLDHFLMKCGVSVFILHADKMMSIQEALQIALRK